MNLLDKIPDFFAVLFLVKIKSIKKEQSISVSDL